MVTLITFYALYSAQQDKIISIEAETFQEFYHKHRDKVRTGLFEVQEWQLKVNSEGELITVRIER